MSVGPVVRPLWRAADSGAEAPKLAARPFECVPRSLRCWIRWISGGYGVATISRLLKIIGLFCKRALQKRQYSAKETYNFKEPTNRSHPIAFSVETVIAQSRMRRLFDE